MPKHLETNDQRKIGRKQIVARTNTEFGQIWNFDEMTSFGFIRLTPTGKWCLMGKWIVRVFPIYSLFMIFYGAMIVTAVKELIGA